jgi:hypothetical protein
MAMVIVLKDTPSIEEPDGGEQSEEGTDAGEDGSRTFICQFSD